MKLGTTELLIILAIILLIFGPSQLPKLAKMFGKSKKSFEEGQQEAASSTTTSEAKSEKAEQ